MQYQYVVSAHKASSVLASVSGAFTLPEATDLVLAKYNRIEVHTLTAATGQLRQVGGWALNGKISTLHFFHPTDRLTGCILVTSEKFQFAVLSWDAAEQRVITESTGEFTEVTGRPTTEAKLVAVDPLNRVIAVYAYQGIVHLLPMDSTQDPESAWRKLLRSRGRKRLGSQQQSLGGLSIGSLATSNADTEKWPYLVRAPMADGLLVPSYLQTTEANSHGRDKGKEVAHAERSSNIYPIMARYIHELKVVDIQFLLGEADELPAFAVLYEDANMQRQVHVYRLGDSQGELQPISEWTSLSLEASAAKLIALPGGNVLVAGDESLSIIGPDRQPLSMSKRASAVTAWTWIDTDSYERLLLADEEGVLSLVVLQYADSKGQQQVQDLFVERLGNTAVASSLTYIDAGCVYVGSHCGDQMLVRLHTQPLPRSVVEGANQRALHMWDETAESAKTLAFPLGDADKVESQTQPNTFVETLELHENLAPLVDMCVVGIGESSNRTADTMTSGSEVHEENGSASGGMEDGRSAGTQPGRNYGSVVSCSGMHNMPGLRVVRNGIGVEPLFSIDISGLLGLWSLTVAQPASRDSPAMDIDTDDARLVLLVLSLVDRTLLLGWREPSGEQVDVAEVALSGWRLGEPTLAAGLTSDGRHVVQATSSAIVLIDSAGWTVQAEWAPGEIGLTAISAVSVSGDQVAAAIDGSTAVYLEVRGGALVCVGRRQLDNAVSCIDIHSWHGAAGPATHVAVGMWSVNDVCLLALPDLAIAAPALSLRMPQGLAPSATAIGVASTGQDSLPRSVLMCTLGNTPYLLAGLGDGRLHQFALSVDTNGVSVREHKSIALGSGPLGLTPFVNQGSLNVFASSDHSAVLFADKHQAAHDTHISDSSSRISKLMYANVDVLGIKRMAPIDSLGLPMSMCLAVGSQMWIGLADPVQRLHIRSFALPRWASPHRISHSSTQGVYAVATIHSLDTGGSLTSTARDLAVWERLALIGRKEQQTKADSQVCIGIATTPPAEVGRLTIMDSQGMNVLASMLLYPYEMPESLCAVSLKYLQRPAPNADATAEAQAEPASLASSSHTSESDSTAQMLSSVFVLGTSVVPPGNDDARCGRILVCAWDAAQRHIHIMGILGVLGAVYALVPFRGMLLTAVNGQLLLLGWQRRAVGAKSNNATQKVCDGVMFMEDPNYELVVLCSQQTQITALSISVSGDYIIVGDVMSSASLYKYEEYVMQASSGNRANGQQSGSEASFAGQIRHRLVPVARDYSGVWTTAVASVPPPLAQNTARLYPNSIDAETGFLARQNATSYERAFRGVSQERFVVADAYNNIIRMARAEDRAAGDGTGVDSERLYVEGRWHLGDMVNVVRQGSLVMDIPDPEFPGFVRPVLIFGTLHGAIGVIASVEDGRLGRALDRLQTNMAHLLPTPGLWDYGQWRGYSSDQRTSQAFGFLDGDLIEQFLDLSPETQQLVFSGGSAHVSSEAVAEAEHQMKSEFWASFSRVEAEGDVAVFSQMAVSNIGQRENVSLDYVVRLVESLTRLH
ncbi:DNA damage-binding protein 1a [Coemansia sp. RSA 1972]|nr:DNA damage-binding protein 1a [Coemansia sp. RSA 1972]